MSDQEWLNLVNVKIRRLTLMKLNVIYGEKIQKEIVKMYLKKLYI